MYVALVAFLAARGLRRWFDPIPVAAAVPFLGILFTLLGPQLLGGYGFLPTDNLRGSVPFQHLTPTEPHGNSLQGDLLVLVAPLVQEVREDILDGRWPLWNDRVGIGMPLLADPQSQPFQPLTLLALPFDATTGAAVTAAFRILLALAFMFLFLRIKGCSLGPSLAGAFAFGTGGFLLLWLGWPLANTAALFPLLLYAQTLLLTQGRRADEVLFFAAFASFLLAGHPETLLMGLGVAALFALGELPPPGHQRRAALRRWCAAAAVAVAVTAPVWLPTLSYLPETQRSAALSAGPLAGKLETLEAESSEDSRRQEGSYLAKSWVPLVAPNAFGNDRYAHYWGRQNTNEDASGFVGTAAILLAVLAIFLGWREKRAEVAAAGLVVVGVVLVLALPEGWQESLRGVPLLEGLFAHGGRRALLFLCFGMAFLAALGLERARREPPPRWLLAALASAFGGVLFWAYLSFPNPRDPTVLEVLRIGWLHWQVRFLVLATLLLIFFPRRKLTAYALAFLIAGELYLLHGPAYPPMPRQDGWPAPPSLEALASEALPGDRVVGVGEALVPNLAALYGWADLRIYNPMAPAAYGRFLAPAFANPGADVPRIDEAGSPILATLGARWFLAAPETSLPAPFRLEVEDVTGRLYSRPDALPRAFVLSPETPGSLGPGWREAPLLGPWSHPEGPILLEGPRISTTLDGEQAGDFAVSVFQHGPANPLRRTGGWRVLADGRLAEADERLNPLLSVSLPPGARRLDAVYRPPGFLLGCWLAALGIAFAGLRWAPGPPRFPSRPGPGLESLS